MKTLKDLVCGEKAFVKKVNGNGPLYRRLLDMGIVSGAKVEMIKHAPLGDPIEYKIRNYHLSLRKSEAAIIEITN